MGCEYILILRSAHGLICPHFDRRRLLAGEATMPEPFPLPLLPASVHRLFNCFPGQGAWPSPAITKYTHTCVHMQTHYFGKYVNTFSQVISCPPGLEGSFTSGWLSISPVSPMLISHFSVLNKTSHGIDLSLGVFGQRWGVCFLEYP